MKHFQKWMTAGMASMMLTSVVLAGCGQEQASEPGVVTNADKAPNGLNASGFPVVKEPVSLRFVARKNPQHGDWKDMLVLQDYEKKTNMKIEYEVYPLQNFEERKNLLFASNDLPDAFINSGISTTEQLKYGTTGMLIPLEDLIDKYAPNLKAIFDKYPDSKKTITAPDGHIYALPTMVELASARTSKMWMNMEWLEKVGSQVPKTTDELYEVLKKFKALNVSSDAVPVSMDLGNNAYFNNDKLRPWLSMFGLNLDMGEAGMVENGKYKLWVDSDRYKEMLNFTHKLFAEKLLDNNTFTNDVLKVNALTTAKKVGLAFGQTTGFVDPNVYKGIAYPKSKFGDPLVTAQPIARDIGAFAITNRNKYPEATIRWVDYFYGEEGSEYLRFGIEGKTYTKGADGVPKYTDEIMNAKPSPQHGVGKFTIWPGAGAPHIITEKNAGVITNKPVEEAQKAIEPYMPKTTYGAPLMDPADAEKFMALQDDLRKFIRESLARFITDGVTEEKWNQYKETLSKLGIKEYEAYYQKALDNYNKK